ncbi:unnamed protein product, partial [Polarella glacialis]
GTVSGTKTSDGVAATRAELAGVAGSLRQELENLSSPKSAATSSSQAGRRISQKTDSASKPLAQRDGAELLRTEVSQVLEVSTELKGKLETFTERMEDRLLQESSLLRKEVDVRAAKLNREIGERAKKLVREEAVRLRDDIAGAKKLVSEEVARLRDDIAGSVEPMRMVLSQETAQLRTELVSVEAAFCTLRHELRTELVGSVEAASCTLRKEVRAIAEASESVRSKIAGVADRVSLVEERELDRDQKFRLLGDNLKALDEEFRSFARKPGALNGESLAEATDSSFRSKIAGVADRVSLAEERELDRDHKFRLLGDNLKALDEEFRSFARKPGSVKGGSLAEPTDSSCRSKIAGVADRVSLAEERELDRDHKFRLLGDNLKALDEEFRSFARKPRALKLADRSTVSSADQPLGRRSGPSEVEQLEVLLEPLRKELRLVVSEAACARAVKHESNQKALKMLEEALRAEFRATADKAAFRERRTLKEELEDSMKCLRRDLFSGAEAAAAAYFAQLMDKGYQHDKVLERLGSQVRDIQRSSSELGLDLDGLRREMLVGPGCRQGPRHAQEFAGQLRDKQSVQTVGSEATAAHALTQHQNALKELGGTLRAEFREVADKAAFRECRTLREELEDSTKCLRRELLHIGEAAGSKSSLHLQEQSSRHDKELVRLSGQCRDMQRTSSELGLDLQSLRREMWLGHSGLQETEVSARQAQELGGEMMAMEFQSKRMAQQLERLLGEAVAGRQRLDTLAVLLETANVRLDALENPAPTSRQPASESVEEGDESHQWTDAVRSFEELMARVGNLELNGGLSQEEFLRSLSAEWAALALELRSEIAAVWKVLGILETRLDTCNNNNANNNNNTNNNHNGRAPALVHLGIPTDRTRGDPAGITLDSKEPWSQAPAVIVSQPPTAPVSLAPSAWVSGCRPNAPKPQDHFQEESAACEPIVPVGSATGVWQEQQFRPTVLPSCQNSRRSPSPQRSCKSPAADEGEGSDSSDVEAFSAALAPEQLERLHALASDAFGHSLPDTESGSRRDTGTRTYVSDGIMHPVVCPPDLRRQDKVEKPAVKKVKQHMLVVIAKQHPRLVVSAWLLFFVGIFAGMYFEKWSFVTACYVIVQITTTIGYGDISVATDGMEYFLAIYILLNLVIMANIVNIVIGHFLERMQIQLQEDFEALEFGQDDKPVPAVSAKTAHIMSATGIFVLVILIGTLFYGSFESCSCSYGVTHDQNKVVTFANGTTVDTCSAEGDCNSEDGWHQSYKSAFYMSVVTATTVGFGDFSPKSYWGRVFGIFWMIIGVAATANFISACSGVIAGDDDSNDKEEDIEQVESISKVLFDSMDKDNNGSLAKSEYMAYMLVKHKFVNPEVLDLIAQRFEEIDVKRTRSVTFDDVIAAKQHACHAWTGAILFGGTLPKRGQFKQNPRRIIHLRKGALNQGTCAKESAAAGISHFAKVNSISFQIHCVLFNGITHFLQRCIASVVSFVVKIPRTNGLQLHLGVRLSCLTTVY